MEFFLYPYFFVSYAAAVAACVAAGGWNAATKLETAAVVVSDTGRV